MIAVLCMTNGRRETITRTIPSAIEQLVPYPLISEFWIHDDSGDPGYRRWLESFGWQVLKSAGKTGFDGAIRSAWTQLRERSQAEYVLHLEDDFVFLQRVPLDGFVEVLQHRPHLVQMALRRQPWNEREILAGGVIEQHPEEYLEYQLGEHRWLEHRLFFTTNPSLYRRDLLERFEWPEGNESEGRFTFELLQADDRHRFGYWGTRGEGHRVEHIGRHRVGSGY